MRKLNMGETKDHALPPSPPSAFSQHYSRNVFFIASLNVASPTKDIA